MRQRLRSWLLTIVALTLMLVPVAPAGAETATSPAFTWTKVHGIPYAGNLTTNGKGIWLVTATGRDSYLRSTDGKTWEALPLPEGATFGIVMWGTDTFVAQAGDGVFTSPDGKSWKRTYTTSSTSSFSYANGRFFMTNIGGGFYVSKDQGQTWSAIQSPALTSVEWINGRYIGFNGDSSIYSSADGQTWTLAEKTANYMIASAVSPKLVVVAEAGEDLKTILHTSKDGQNWSRQTIPYFVADITYGRGELQMLAADQNDGIQILHSTDGITWAPVVTEGLDPRGGDLTGLRIDSQYYWAYGPGLLYRSTDGKKWELASSDYLRGSLNAVTWGNGRWMTVGQNGQVLTSTDGVKWDWVKLESTDHLYSVAYANNRYVIGSGEVNGSAKCNPSLNQCKSYSWTSTDGLTWTKGEVNAYGLRTIVGGGDAFLALDGRGRIYRAADGLKWERITTTALFDSILYANRAYWAMEMATQQSPASKLWTSTDGKEWKVAYTFPMGKLIMGLGKTQNEMVAYGYGGTFYTSTEGFSWRPNAVPTSSPLKGELILQLAGDSKNMVGLWTRGSWSFINPVLMAKGDDPGAHKYATLSIPNMSSVAYHENRFVAVGTGGTIYTWLSVPAPAAPATPATPAGKP